MTRLRPFQKLPQYLLIIQIGIFSMQQYLAAAEPITETTPSRSMYFSWINNTWEGSTAEQTLTNLEFFKWLHDQYGMKLDIYLLDAGNIDGWRKYGSMDSKTFKKKFPKGLEPLVKKAASFNCRLGMWLGPDGFGETPAEEKKRSKMLLKLCRDLNFALLKLDKCCSALRTEKQDILSSTLTECRQSVPDLIVLNHRIKLGKAEPHSTTFLWGGTETYIDVKISNNSTAPHHRQGALSRGLPPKLKRLTEDHGVCLSSCMDAWDDDLILQAFNRSLILAPEIYGNPWLMRDDEFPRLARIFNLHRQYRDILTKAIKLPKGKFGLNAVSRGNSDTRFITLRNLTWEPVKHQIPLDKTIGLNGKGKVNVLRLHPDEELIGTFSNGKSVEVEVAPFRSFLLMVSTKPIDLVSTQGCSSEIVCSMPNRPVELNLLGLPGTQANVKIKPGKRKFTQATLNGKDASKLLKQGQKVSFPGTKLKQAWHRKLGDLTPTKVPDDAEALYEATCFAADNNVLEVRSLKRAGNTKWPAVEKARKALLQDPKFVGYGFWDKFLFDGDSKTKFSSRRGKAVDGGMLRLDFGKPIHLDKLELTQTQGKFDLGSAEVSADLKTWTPVKAQLETKDLRVQMPKNPVQYFRISGFKNAAEAQGWQAKKLVDRKNWRASCLFRPYAKAPAKKAWTHSFKLSELPKDSYLAIALNGKHGLEGAYAALRVDGKPVGAPDRSLSYPAGVWETGPIKADKDYTYYIPLKKEYLGKKLEVVVLGFNPKCMDFKPEAWITTHQPPYEKIKLVLK